MRCFLLSPLLTAVLLAGAPTRPCAAQIAPAPAPAMRVAAASPTSAAQPDPARPGDVIRLRIWREPDMSGDFPIDEHGVAVLPKLGAMPVTNRPADVLQRDLVAAYVPFLSHSSVAVTVLRRVQITGAVKNPGLYPLDPTVTIGEAITVAGGITPDGRNERVDLVRGGKRVAVVLTRDMRVGDSPVHSGDQLVVPERSWLSRNAVVVVSAVSAAASILVLKYR